MGGRLGVLKPMSGDSEQRCPFSADSGDILLPVITHICCNFILPPEAQAALLSDTYSQGTNPRENTFSERSPTKHPLLYCV
jgi:hypothetical protein